MKSHDQTTETTTKTKRQQYSPQFREHALELAKQDAAPKAAKDLGIVQAMLYSWQAKDAKRASRLKIRNYSMPRWHG